MIPHPALRRWSRQITPQHECGPPLIAGIHIVALATTHFVKTQSSVEPPGRHVLRLCRAEACQSVGAEALAEHVRRRLGVDWHDTTADGAVTLEPVFCLGLCAVGPSALLDGTPLGRLDNARIDSLLERAR